MQRLRAAEDRRDRLRGHADEVDLGLLRGELHTCCLRMEAQHLRLRIVCAELIAHDTRPDATRGAKLRHLFEQGRARHEEEREPGRELVDVLTGRNRGAHVFDAVSEGEPDLLRGRRAGLRHVIAGDRDGVPFRDLGPAIAEHVGDEAQ